MAHITYQSSVDNWQQDSNGCSIDEVHVNAEQRCHQVAGPSNEQENLSVTTHLHHVLTKTHT